MLGSRSKSRCVASICLEIGEVVEEQAPFDLDVVSNQSDSNQRTRSYRRHEKRSKHSSLLIQMRTEKIGI